ncbi:MAG: phosphate/phosphite/phosphonate ABC transporter substrate-binding protein [Prochloraceae cyanobacterium]|nr:phosphate/phosphite/phosphonate ABC transporter substrate-binding protein [Prochloraceae cyanobacterium]
MKWHKLLVLTTLVGILNPLTGCKAVPEAVKDPNWTSQASNAISDTSTTIVLADISNYPSENIERLQPLADYLAAQLKDCGINMGEVKVARDLETMSGWLSSGQVDLYLESPYPATIAIDRSGAKPILRRWKGGAPEYHALFFARADRGFTSLTDLAGKKIAFDEPVSTSGYLLPLAYSIEKNLNPVEKKYLREPVLKNEVGYIFSGDDENVIQWVLKGWVAAGVLDNLNFKEIPPQIRAQLKVLARTEAVPRQLVLVREDLDPKLVSAIKTILIDMDKTPEGRDLLQKLEKTTKFDEFPEGTEAVLARMRELYELVQRGGKAEEAEEVGKTGQQEDKRDKGDKI